MPGFTETTVAKNNADTKIPFPMRFLFMLAFYEIILIKLYYTEHDKYNNQIRDAYAFFFCFIWITKYMRYGIQILDAADYMQK